MFNDVKKRYDNTQLHVWGCGSVRSHGHHLVIDITNALDCSLFCDSTGALD